MFEPDLVMTDGEALLVSNNISVGVDAPDKTIEAWNPYRTMFDVVWSGRRHVMMGASQLDPYGNQNFAFIGDPAQPKVQLLGMRGAPGNTVQNVTSYWIPAHSPRVFVEKIDVVSGVGYDRAAELGEWVKEHHELRRVVTNLARARLRRSRPPAAPRERAPGRHRRRRRRGHRVRARVGVNGADSVEETRPPTPEETEVIARLDPKGMRGQEVPG